MLTARRSLSQCFVLLAFTVLFIVARGCSETAPPSGNPNDSTLAPPAKPVGLLPSNAPIGSSTPAPGAGAIPMKGADPVAKPSTPESSLVIPPGARWTIYCYAVKGPDHVVDSQKAKASLIQQTGRNGWYVIHGRDESNIYFGFYSFDTVADKAGTSDLDLARQDLELVKGVQDVNHSTPFRNSVFVMLDAPDPLAPPEWNLYNVDRTLRPTDPKRAYWSLQIMAFRGVEQRKEAAVEAVRDLRKQGVDAYYYHGESVSSVCVGHWPADAVKSQNRTEEMPDVAHSSAESNLMVSSIPIPENLYSRPLDGKPTVSVAPKIEVQDKSMEKAMQKFPDHAVNYEVGREYKDGKEFRNHSFLVVIPRAPGDGLYDNASATPTAPRGPAEPEQAPRRPSMINPR